MSANAYLANATTRNSVFLQRLAAGEFQQVNAILTTMEREVNGVISSASQADFNSGQVLADVQEITDARFKEISSQVSASAQETAAYSSTSTARMINRVAKIDVLNPDPEKVTLDMFTSSINLKPQGSKKTINDVINEYGTKKASQFNNIVSDGILTGKNSQELTSEVSELMKISRRQAETLVRTTTNNAAQVGRVATFQENEDILEGMENVATLDSRCTPFCKQIDGKVVPLDSPEKPAYHYGCRTQLVAKIKQQYTIPNVESGERKAEGDDTTANTTYGGWLSKQSAEFQNEALGPNRAKLFRDGGLKLDKFVDPTGRTYTLKELEALEPMAFEEAGLLESPQEANAPVIVS